MLAHISKHYLKDFDEKLKLIDLPRIRKADRGRQKTRKRSILPADA